MATLAPSLVAFRNQINARWPHRDRGSDGWIGDGAHCPGTSDHCPDESGMVHAIDIDKDGINVNAVLAAAIGDPRCRYVIHNATIWSRTYGWVARPYTQPNPHRTHIHVSIRYDSTSETDTRNWFGSVAPTSGLPYVDVSNVVAQFKAPTKDLPGVRLVQRALNDRLGLVRAQALTVDGHAGPRTRSAMRAYQARLKSLGWTAIGTDGVPNEKLLRWLGRGRWTTKP